MSVNVLIHRQICIHQNDLSCYEYTHISSSRSNNTIRNNRNDNDHFLTFYFKELSTLDVYEFVCVYVCVCVCSLSCISFQYYSYKLIYMTTN